MAINNIACKADSYVNIRVTVAHLASYSYQEAQVSWKSIHGVWKDFLWFWWKRTNKEWEFCSVRASAGNCHCSGSIPNCRLMASIFWSHSPTNVTLFLKTCPLSGRTNVYAFRKVYETTLRADSNTIKVCHHVVGK